MIRPVDSLHHHVYLDSQTYTVAMAHIASNAGSHRQPSAHSRLTDARSNTSVELKV